MLLFLASEDTGFFTRITPVTRESKLQFKVGL